MRNMRPPAIPEEPVPILSEDELRRLFRACDGRTFDDRRDNAIVSLFLDTGLRRAELAALQVSDIDFETSVAVVMGKGRRPLTCSSRVCPRQDLNQRGAQERVHR
jgi:integrase